MKWKKKGLIYCANKESEWKFQWAMLPTPFLINNDCLRIFCGICDAHNIGRIGYVDVLPSNPACILEISENPVLDVGDNGCFDDNGVVPVSIIKKNNQIYLYYIGFQKGVKIPYYMFCGLAISDDNGQTFRRYSKSPVLDRFNDEVYARCGVNVLEDDGIYKMWYIGSFEKGWTYSQGILKPLYVMKYTTSNDGINWHNESILCMNYKNKDEHGFGRPHIWKDRNIYKMYYSVRTYSRGYYIGYAESEDGKIWTRKDDIAGINLSQYGWDSLNISYPYIFKYKDKTYMFYNGNGCGKTGFGYAELLKT